MKVWLFQPKQVAVVAGFKLMFDVYFLTFSVIFHDSTAFDSLQVQQKRWRATNISEVLLFSICLFSKGCLSEISYGMQSSGNRAPFVETLYLIQVSAYRFAKYFEMYV